MSAPRHTAAVCARICNFSPRSLLSFSRDRCAHRGAEGLVSDAWFPLVEQAMLVFLLLIGLRGNGILARPPEPPHQRAGFAAARQAGCAKRAWAWQQAGAWRWSACCR